ncbi:hypothetical protein H4217_000807 [Coemansia sp. RSA 1939]|nr:hypothetical protein H4217_000807 [Coemansia sp. RSA 1939]KAJ2616030.1 hypothetical protein EV177_001269 [Coemansia sp. RSA 1804]
MAVSNGLLCDPTVKQHHGYIDIGNGKNLFYWFFESRNSQRIPNNTPVVLWLNGGPGCSSMAGLFSGIGPCWVNDNGNGTTPNTNSWNTDAHLLFLDQPVNTGYSYGPRNVTTTTEQAAKDVTAFLDRFHHTFPEYLTSRLYVAGESYAAHYVPAIAANLVVTARTPWPNNRMWLPRLGGIIVGNGLFNMAFQYRSLYTMACLSAESLVSHDADTCSAMRNATNEFYQQSLAHWNKQTTATALNATYAGFGILAPYQLAGYNPYDVRTKCPPSDTMLCDKYMDTVTKYANHPDVQKALDIRPISRPFELCDHEVQMSFVESGDEFSDVVSAEWLPMLLNAGIPALVYAGDADLICNWMGIKELLLHLSWYGRPGFALAPDVPWTNRADGSVAGSARVFGGLSFLRIHGAGHMVANEKPQIAHSMFKEWVSNN